MANNLAILQAPEKALSLPPPVTWLLGTLEQTKWPGREMIWNFPTGITMKPEERSDAETALAATQKALDANNPDRQVCSKARLSLLTRALMAFSAGLGPREETDAKIEVYLGALGDVPPWAIQGAISAWAKGDAGGLGMGGINYSFMPAPAILHALCERELRPYREQEAHLERLLSAVSLDEAMSPKPQVVAFRRIP